jgi:competence protein ComEA
MIRQLLNKTAVPIPLVLAAVIGAGALTTPQPRAHAQAPAKEKAKPATKIDINKATAEELAENLPGVGPVTAKKIVDGRPYTNIDGLTKAGVPARTIEAIRPLVTFSTPAPAATKTKGMTKTKGATPAAPGLVNLNTATPAELQELPGVGPVVAQAIVAGRPYKSVDDLEKVRGLGAARIEALRDRVTVAAPESPAATKTGTAARTPRLAPGQVVNINTAPKEVLDLLPGIGPVKAQAIIEGRPFKTKEDIMKVKGIKEGEFSKIKDVITVN